MSEHFTPIPFDKLLQWVINEYDTKKSIFSIPAELFFVPKKDMPFTLKKYGKLLETPIGVAAGPHTQMAQNLIAAWLCGARFLELKTVQILDELTVSKPCIDMEDEGYNCEWSQELKLEQSFDEYLKAWIIIHILRHKLQHENGTTDCGMIFNMSVGYNLEGIQSQPVQNFLKKMRNASRYIQQYTEIAAKFYSKISSIKIPECLSDNITLSTMHGCPPAEIEKIAIYLIQELGFHTTIKFNPTLLGKDNVRHILNDTLGFSTEVPDIAFEHDPLYENAVSIIKSLSKASESVGKEFSFKLSNTLESVNNKNVFDKKEAMMYMSGRPLHVIDVNLANRLIGDFDGEMKVSFSGGADAFNLHKLVQCGIMPVTICSDILKPGGYGRMKQYLDNLEADMKKHDAQNFDIYIVKTFFASCKNKDEVIEKLEKKCRARSKVAVDHNKLLSAIQDFPSRLKLSNLFDAMVLNELVKICSVYNIHHYAEEVLKDPRYRKDFIDSESIKGSRTLGYFDCISAPCTEECPVHQNIPDYMYCIANKKFDEALDVILKDNPLPTIAGRVCDHLCQTKCVRSNIDKSLAIRNLKRFVTDNVKPKPKTDTGCTKKVAVIGAGPSGLSCSYFLAREGAKVTIFEQHANAGGMAANAIPSFRLSKEKIEQDIAMITGMGVEIRFNQKIGKDVMLKDLMKDYDAVYIAAGAQKGLKLGIDGENTPGVFDCLEFLAALRNSEKPEIGQKVGVIGGGNSAMDVARAAWRMGADVTVIYRRTEKEMPADREEIEALKHEGIKILELAAPHKVVAENGRVSGLECIKMQLGEPDESGRRKPVAVEGSNFTEPLDSILVAISQSTVLDFIEGSGVDLTSKGTIKTDAETLKTSVANVYAGGDVSRGPATLIKAAGDGKIVACSILGISADSKNVIEKNLTPHELIVRKSQKVYPVHHGEKGVDIRRNFDEFEYTYSEKGAVNEASRCLYCDQLCSICETVCPNRANMMYEVIPVTADIPVIALNGGSVTVECTEKYAVSQKYQILNIGDSCNECGNCTTFCPSSGAPYKEKPKVYFTKSAFDDNTENAFHFEKTADNLVLVARMNGQISRLHHMHISESCKFKYECDEFSCTIDENLGITNIKPGPKSKDGSYSTKLCADMYMLYYAAEHSMKFLPF